MWQTIETIPEQYKNPPVFLLFAKKHEYGDDYAVGYWSDNYGCGYWRSSINEPTHWMPIEPLTKQEEL